MPRRIQTIDIPIVYGERQDIDPKMLPIGAVARVKNLRLRKDGRWGVRNDFTALAATTPFVTSLRATDLHIHDGRLVALGAASSVTTAVPSDAFEYVDTGAFAWKPTDDSAQLRLNPVQYAHNVGRLPTQAISVQRTDCAAGNGLVCLVAQNSTTTSQVHIFQPGTDSTVLVEQISATSPRVVEVSGTFFIAGLNSSDEVELYSFDPTSNKSLQQLTDAFATGDTIVNYDMVENAAGDGFWIALARNTPTTTLRPFDSSGTAGTDITGPTTSFLRIAMIELDSGVTNPVQLVAVHSDQTVNAYGYTAAGALGAGPTQLLSGAVTSKQPALGYAGTGRQKFTVIAETTGTDLAIEHTILNTHGGGVERTWYNATLESKVAHIDDGTTLGVPMCGGCFVEDGAFRTNFLGVPTQEHIAAVKDVLVGGSCNNFHLPSIAYDSSTGKHYWPNLVQDADGRTNVQVTEVRAGSDDRRQSASLGGHMYLSGGSVQVFDSRSLVESGFQSRPRLENVTASNGAGSLPSSVTILVAAHYEWQDAKGDVHLSPISEVETVTMGASDDTIDLDVVGPFSMRDNLTSDVLSGSVKVVVYRSEGDRKILKRATAVDVGEFGEDVSVTLTDNDAFIATEPAIYTQAGRAALGDILQHEAPRPARYMWRAGNRLVLGGLPDPFQIQVSKALFPGEPVEFSEDLGFFVSIPERVAGVAALDNTVFAFSRDSIFVFPAVGPDDAGTDDIPAPIRLPSATGLKDFRSLVETPLGLVFQGDDDKLWLIPRGGGAPVSFGDAVEDTLADYPTVVGACVSREEQLVTFACSNSGGTDTRLLSYDLRAQVWSDDEFTSAEPVEALVSYQGRAAYVSEGIVLLEDSDAVPSAFIEHGMETGTIRPFKDNAWGRFCWGLWLCEFRGDCTATARISYDDGVNWTTIKAFELLTSEFTAGDTVRLQVYPKRRKGDRFRLDLQVTALAGAATEGLVINELTIGVIGETGGPRDGRKRG